MEHWNRQIKLARYMLLATVIVTVINIACLLGNVDLFISYCASAPYYLVLLGKMFDNNWFFGPINGEFTATGLTMAGVLLGFLLVVWWLSRTRRSWLLVGLVTIIADLAVLIFLAVKLFENWLDCFMEAALHLAVIWEMVQGLRAWKRKEESPAEPMEESEEAPVEEYV